jgi:hypothetical protein
MARAREAHEDALARRSRLEAQFSRDSLEGMSREMHPLSREDDESAKGLSPVDRARW